MEDNIYNYNLKITGPKTTLVCIMTLIDKLAEITGSPHDPIGIFVPISVLMRVLIGEDDMSGNIIRYEMTYEALNLHIDCPLFIDEHLQDALLEIFNDIEVEIIEEST